MSGRSYATLSELAGIRAKSWAHTLVAQLREERFLDVTPDKRLKPGPRFFERDLFESIRAGLPEQASEDSSSVVTIDRYLIQGWDNSPLPRRFLITQACSVNCCPASGKGPRRGLAVSVAVDAILNNQRARCCPRQSIAGAGHGEDP